MDLHDVIKAKIEMENSICCAIRAEMEHFEKETGITPSHIHVHLAPVKIINMEVPNELYSPQIQHAVIGVEATVTL